MASRFMQLQTEAAYSSRSSRTSSPHRPQPQTTSNYSQRTSTSSDSSTSTNSSYYEPRISIDSAPRVEVLRCSRCAKCVETISAGRKGDDLRRVSTEDASANGMVRFGHNLYYCDRCARMVGYK